MKNDFGLFVALEDLEYRTRQLASMSNALYVAMFEGPNAASDYDPAMNLLECLLMEHADATQALLKKVGDASELEVKA